MAGLPFNIPITGATVIGWLWVLATIPIIGVMLFAALYFWKSNRFVYPVLIVRDFGAGKVMIDQTRAGKFRKIKTLFGLIDTGGEYELLTKKGQIITNHSDNDMHDVFGKKGFMVMQKPDDQRVLVPISKTELKNMEFMMQIAPADFRDVAVALKKKSEKEMLSGLETLMPYISLMIVAIVVFLIFVITFQFVSGTLSDLATKCGTTIAPIIPQLPSAAP